MLQTGESAIQTLFAPQCLTIDYLHIDADHSFEACLADFRAYRPFLREGAVVTLHDTSFGGGLLSDTSSNTFARAVIVRLWISRMWAPERPSCVWFRPPRGSRVPQYPKRLCRCVDVRTLPHLLHLARTGRTSRVRRSLRAVCSQRRSSGNAQQ